MPAWALRPPPLLTGAMMTTALMIGLWFTLRHIEKVADAGKNKVDRSAVMLAQREQEIADLKRAVATERRRATITEEKNDALSSELANTRLRVAAHVERVRDETDRAFGEGADLPRFPDGAGRADEAGADTVISVSDLDICAENSIRLINARAWLREQQKVSP